MQSIRSLDMKGGGRDGERAWGKKKYAPRSDRPKFPKLNVSKKNTHKKETYVRTINFSYFKTYNFDFDFLMGNLWRAV